MNKRTRMSVIIGLLGFGLLVGSAFAPWIQWLWQTDATSWFDSTSVWGPPAYISVVPEATYAIVEIETGSQALLDGLIGAYLFFFLLGTGLWGGLLWAGKSAAGKRMVSTGGVISIVPGVGVVLLLGLAPVIAQRVGLYAAIATDNVVTVEFVSVQPAGPLLMLAGIILEAVAIFRSRQ